MAKMSPCLKNKRIGIFLRQRQEELGVPGELSLQRKFQESQGYITATLTQKKKAAGWVFVFSEVYTQLFQIAF